MAGFTADWLALREPADHAARSRELTRALLFTLPGDARILDLAAGTGSNLRYLTAMGGGLIRPSDFLLVDHDPALLARVPGGAETRCADLSTLDDDGIFDGRALVTASALLDLVSEDWLRALASRCASAGAAVLFALTYDGRIACTPDDADDALVAALVNDHQRIDKGFGPALGPGATDAAARCFEAAGYRIRRARSDWTLTAASARLQEELIEGWAQAATEISPQQARLIDAWRNRRLAHVAAGWSEILVGHEDLAGIAKSRV
jgi:hypothetical protein